MAKVKMQITGLDKIVKNLQMAQQQWIRSFEAAVYLEANNWMAESKRIVPVDTGTLKGSGYVTLPERQGNKIVVEMGYGGPAATYAVIQHENMYYRHRPGQQAKYLSTIINRYVGKFKDIVGIIASEHFRQGSGGASKTAGMPTHPDEVGPLGYKRSGGKRPKQDFTKASGTRSKAKIQKIIRNKKSK